MNQKGFIFKDGFTFLPSRTLVQGLIVWCLMVFGLGLIVSCSQDTNNIPDEVNSSGLSKAVKELSKVVKDWEKEFKCDKGVQHQVITKGFLDMFGPAIDPVTTPSSSLITWFNSLGYGGLPTLAGYDGQSVNQYFGDTFLNLPNNITKAFFITGVRGIGEIQNNDGLTIGRVGTPTPNDTSGGPIANLPSPWITSTLTNNELVAAIELSSGFMNSLNQELDVVVQDDTSVDFTRLHICYKKKQKRFDLSIKKLLEGDYLTIGNQATYNIQVTNHGPSAATTNDDIIVTDTLPAGVVWDTVNPLGWSCDNTPNPQIVMCTYIGPSAIPPNTSVTLSLTVGVTEKVGEVARNCAKVSANGDIVDENNESCIKDPVRPDEFCLDISTGSIDSNTPLSIGDLDQDWKITSTQLNFQPPNIYTGPSIVTEFGSWFAPHAAHSEWIMPYDPENPPDLADYNSWVNKGGLYVYQRDFSIPPGFSSCTLNVTRHASDNGSYLELDSGAISPSLPNNSILAFTVGQSLSHNFATSVLGSSHTLKAHVTNQSNSITGLLVEAKVICN